MISCWVTYITQFKEEEQGYLQPHDEKTGKAKRYCTGVRLISYVFDLIGLGILPAFWRALKLKRIYENIYGEINSSRKEFMRQNAVSALGLHLPLVVLYLYANFQNLNITKFESFSLLILPFTSIFYSSFHIFKGSYESVFLVSGARIIVLGFISLSTDFLIRVFSWVGLLSFFLRVAICEDGTHLCHSLMREHGENFCISEISRMFTNNGTLVSECCQCGGGVIPTHKEAIRLKLYAFFLVVGVIWYEVIWVFIFHFEYSRVDTRKLSWKAKLNNFLIKIAQAIVLSVTMLMVNIPVLGMYRPRYRALEHSIRILMSIAFGVLYIMWDKIIKDTFLVISIGCIFPVHIISYILFENYFNRMISSAEDEIKMMRRNLSTASSGPFDEKCAGSVIQGNE